MAAQLSPTEKIKYGCSYRARCLSRQETGDITNEMSPKLSERLTELAGQANIMADEPHSNGEATCTRNSTLPEEFVPAECKFKMHTFSEMILDQKVHFQILKMTDSLYFWIGNSLEMDSLAVAMCTKFVSIFENSEIACKLEYI